MYTVYKTVNLVNGKYYIGVHKTDNPNDDYLGSGKLIKKAIEKYGVESFSKEILEIFEDKDDAYKLEAELVIIGEMSYNLKEGGEGGFDWINANGLTSTKTEVKFTNDQRTRGGHSTAQKYHTDPEYKKKKDAASAKAIKDHGITFLGKTHSDESKIKIGESNSVAQKGERNSQYGTIWITNGVINSKIKKENLIDYEPLGWYRGRTNKK